MKTKRKCLCCGRVLIKFVKRYDSKFRKYHKTCWDRNKMYLIHAVPDTCDGWFIIKK